jgi:hypothetical protein
LLLGIIKYIETDLESRKTLFDDLISNIDFIKFEREYLIKISKKHGWTNDSSFFLNSIILKDDSGSEDSDLSEIDEDDEIEEEDENPSNSLPKFNSKLISNNVKLSNKNRTATYIGKGGWNGSVSFAKVEKIFAIKIVTPKSMMVGKFICNDIRICSIR